MSDKTVSDDTIVIERTFDAPIDLIWQMWTQPEHFKSWYGPQGFDIRVSEMDVRVGGKRLFGMETQTPDGPMKMWLTGEYTEIVPHKRLVYTESMSDEHGNIIPSPDDSYPAITEITVLLEDLNGRTKMIMTHAGVPDAAEGASEGWAQAIDKMAGQVKALLNQ